MSAVYLDLTVLASRQSAATLKADQDRARIEALERFANDAIRRERYLRCRVFAIVGAGILAGLAVEALALWLAFNA